MRIRSLLLTILTLVGLVLGSAKSADAQVGTKATAIKINAIIFWGNTFGYHQAASCLRWWEIGMGQDLLVSANLWRYEQYCSDYLAKTVRPQLIAGARNRVGTKLLKPGGPPVTITLLSSNVQGQGDLYYSFGTFSLDSTVQVTLAQKVSGKTTTNTINFVSWQTRLYDYYNWDPKRWYVFGPYPVSGQEMIDYEYAWLARPYRVYSPYVGITDPSIVGSYSYTPTPGNP
jgi:hypothetical protein